VQNFDSRTCWLRRRGGGLVASSMHIQCKNSKFKQSPGLRGTVADCSLGPYTVMHVRTIKLWAWPWASKVISLRLRHVHGNGRSSSEPSAMCIVWYFEEFERCEWDMALSSHCITACITLKKQKPKYRFRQCTPYSSFRSPSGHQNGNAQES